MNSGLRGLLAALLGGAGALCGPAVAEENSGNVLAALGSTSISGNVSAASHWQTRAFGREPAVGVVAIRPRAHEGKRISRSPGSGAFKFSRGGDISKPLSIYFLVDGTATAGVDYIASSNGKPFPIVSAIQPASNYALASASSVTIVITGPPIVLIGPPVVTNIFPPAGSIRMVDWIVIPAGRRTTTLNIDPKDDRLREMAESVMISIVSDGNPDPSRASVQIIDND